MVANVRRNGEKLLVEIDADLFRRSGIDPDRPLDVDVESGRLILSSQVPPGLSDEEVERAFQKADRQYGRMLKKLAE